MRRETARPNPDPDELLTAEQAARALGVTRPTLYAYVSRGLLTSRFPEAGARERRYAAGDVQALLDRRAARADPDALARRALYEGAPLVRTAISVWEGGAPFYRGRCVAGLAKRRSVERVAALLWLGDDRAAPRLFPRARRPDEGESVPRARPWYGHEAARALVAATLDELARPAPRADAAGLAETGARWLDHLARALSGEARADLAVAEHLRRAFPGAANARVFDAALILGADAPMDATTLAVRGVASTRTHPLAAVLTGLAAALGEWREAEFEAVDGLLDAAIGRGAAAALAGGRDAGHPAFRHPAYPHGDPRGAALWALTRELFPGEAVDAVADLVRRAGGRPTLLLALGALERAAGLPRGAAFPVWLLGRGVGWTAHVIEQSTQGTMRPASSYEGEAPDSVAP